MIMWPKTLTLQSNPWDIDIPAFFIFLWFYSGWSYCADTGKQLKPLIRRRAKGRLSFTAEQRNFFGTHRPQFLVHTSQVLVYRLGCRNIAIARLKNDSIVISLKSMSLSGQIELLITNTILFHPISKLCREVGRNGIPWPSSFLHALLKKAIYYLFITTEMI